MAADPADIRGWQRLNTDITTSGRIEDADVERLVALGVRQVINLSLLSHPEALADAAAKFAAQGVVYSHVRSRSMLPKRHILLPFALQSSKDQNLSMFIAS